MESSPPEACYVYSPRSAPDLGLVQRLEVRIRKAELEAKATNDAVQSDLQLLALRPLPKLTRPSVQTSADISFSHDLVRLQTIKGKSSLHPSHTSPPHGTPHSESRNVPFQVKGSKFTAWNRSYMENRSEHQARDINIPIAEERPHRAGIEPPGYTMKPSTKLHLQQINIPVRMPSPPQNSPARVLSSIDINEKSTPKVTSGGKKSLNSKHNLRQDYEISQRESLTMPKINNSPPQKTLPENDKSLRLQGSSCSVTTFEPPRNTGLSRMNPATHPEYFDYIYGEIFPKGTIENGLCDGFTLVGDYLPGNALRSHRQHTRGESRNQPNRMMPDSPVPNVEYLPNHGLTGKKLVRIPNKNVTVKVLSPRPNPWKDEESSRSPPPATYVPPNSVSHHLSSFGHENAMERPSV